MVFSVRHFRLVLSETGEDQFALARHLGHRSLDGRQILSQPFDIALGYRLARMAFIDFNSQFLFDRRHALVEDTDRLARLQRLAFYVVRIEHVVARRVDITGQLAHMPTIQRHASASRHDVWERPTPCK